MDFAEIDAGGGPETGIQLGVALFGRAHTLVVKTIDNIPSRTEKQMARLLVGMYKLSAVQPWL